MPAHLDHCSSLPGWGLHPRASKPSGPALVTPHISLCVQPGGPPPVPGPLQHPPTSRAFAPAMPICPVLISSFGSQLLSSPPRGLSWPVLYLFFFLASSLKAMLYSSVSSFYKMSSLAHVTLHNHLSLLSNLGSHFITSHHEGVSRTVPSI